MMRYGLRTGVISWKKALYCSRGSVKVEKLWYPANPALCTAGLGLRRDHQISCTFAISLYLPRFLDNVRNFRSQSFASSYSSSTTTSSTHPSTRSIRLRSVHRQQKPSAQQWKSIYTRHQHSSSHAIRTAYSVTSAQH